MPYVIRIDLVRAKSPLLRVRGLLMQDATGFYKVVVKTFCAKPRLAQYVRPPQVAQTQTWDGLKVQFYMNHHLWTASTPGMILWLRMNQPAAATVMEDTP